MGRRRAFVETLGLTLAYFAVLLPARVLLTGARFVRHLLTRCKNALRSIGKGVLAV